MFLSTASWTNLGVAIPIHSFIPPSNKYILNGYLTPNTVLGSAHCEHTSFLHGDYILVMFLEKQIGHIFSDDSFSGKTK